MSDNVINSEKIVEKLILECEFCGTIFKYKGSLVLHQKTAKYCLKIQLEKEAINSMIENYVCEYCNKKFSRKNQFISHQNNCNFKLIEKTVNGYKKEISSKNEKIFYLEKLLDEKDKYLKIQEEIFEKERNDFKTQIKSLEDTISKIAVKASMKPTTTTKNKTVINNLQSFSYNDLKGCSDKLTIDTIKKGPQGHVELILPFIQGKVECTDFSRKTMKHKSKKGKVVTDPEGFKIIKKYSQAIESKNEELTKEYKAEIDLALKTSEPLETTVLVGKSYEADVLNSEIKKTAKGEPTDFSATLSKRICLATISPEVEVSSKEFSISESEEVSEE